MRTKLEIMKERRKAKERGDLPADCIAKVERVLGNTAISQFLARQSELTVLEEMQASRRAA